MKHKVILIDPAKKGSEETIISLGQKKGKGFLILKTWILKLKIKPRICSHCKSLSRNVYLLKPKYCNESLTINPFLKNTFHLCTTCIDKLQEPLPASIGCSQEITCNSGIVAKCPPPPN